MSVATPIFFKSAFHFRKWLEKNHEKATEIIVGFHKIKTGKPSLTWSESVDQALCFGWIDGIRKSIDEDSYCIRFTPRKKDSIWSNINIKKVEELSRQGLMLPAGIKAFGMRKDDKSGVYSHENPTMNFSAEYKKLLMANIKAFSYFEAQSAYYKKVATRWVMSAKQQVTQIKRMHQLIAKSEKGERVY